MRLTMFIILMLTVCGVLFAQTDNPERLANEAEVAGDEAFNANDRATAAQKYEEAIGHYQTAAANGIPSDAEIARIKDKLFKAYYFSDQFMKAVELLEEKLAANPRDYKTAKTIAQIYDKKLGQPDKAVETLVAFDNANPSFAARKLVAKYYKDMSQPRKAIEWYQKATEIQTDAKVIQNIAVLYRELGDNANAVKAYEDYIATNPEDRQKIKTYANMGVLYEDMQNFGKAIASYESSLGLKYDEAIATKLLVLYYDQGDWDQAMTKVNLMLAKNANDETAIYYRALIKIKQGDKQGAIDDFKKIQNSSKYGADAKANIKALQG